MDYYKIKELISVDNKNFKSQLGDRLLTEFGCTQYEAEQVAEKASLMRDSMNGSFEDFDVTINLVVDKMHEAPGHFAMPVKWNWWAGQIRFFDTKSGNFKID